MAARKILPAVLAFALAACNAPEAPTAQPAPDTRPQAEASALDAPAQAQAQPDADRCDYVARLFDDLVDRKAAGMTEREALAELSARGDFALGYVVDGVFGDRFGPGGSVAAKVDTLAACRRMAAGGKLY